jgi:hypothetical protein
MISIEDSNVGLEFDVNLEFDEFEQFLLADFWPGSSMMVRISPKLNTDVLSLSDDLNRYKLIGAAGTWKYSRSFFQ